MTLAAVLLLFGGAVGIMGAPFMYGASPKAVGAILFAVVLLFTGYGLLHLRKWAYWAYVAVSALGALLVAADVVVILLGLAPGETVGYVRVIKGLLGIVWVVYFATSTVRKAFGVGSVSPG